MERDNERSRVLRILDAHKKDLGPLWLRLRNLIDIGGDGELVYKPAKTARKKRKP